MDFERVDSCHSTWMLDTERRRYCRLPAGVKVERTALEGMWEPYFGLEMDEGGAYVLALNESGSRLLRFWRHTDPCPHCAGDRTEELALEATRETD